MTFAAPKQFAEALARRGPLSGF